MLCLWTTSNIVNWPFKCRGYHLDNDDADGGHTELPIHEMQQLFQVRSIFVLNLKNVVDRLLLEEALVDQIDHARG
jgi:hypothetical protein